jgi:hypothetical protein
LSHYSEVKTTFKDEKALLAALIDCGFTKEEIEVHKKPDLLAVSSAKAHIIVRKEKIHANGKFGHAYTDLGFEKVDGTYKAHIDDYTFRQQWQNRLQQRYDYRLQTERARILGYQLTEKLRPDGSIQVIARR